ncbi:hypothetical protein [Nonomuraea sp. NPDC049158]|uniref:hypothetical protein n=1 Tax=Nonomuraea sp. NPDC049158 TaxID=3155649 RepID=UPI0033F8E0D0
MVRQSQVEKIKTAARECDIAVMTGSRQEQERCLAVLNALERNSTRDEINAAITS